MSYSDITFSRIQAHLDSISLQEQDARKELSNPDVHPWIREQLNRLIARLTEERRAIEMALRESDHRGRAAS